MTLNEPARVTPIPAVLIPSEIALTRTESYENGEFKYSAFYFVDAEEKVWFGRSPKRLREIRLGEFQSLLKPIRDEDIFPEVPADLTIAPEGLYGTIAFTKRPGLSYCESETKEDPPWIPEEILGEALTLERLSKEAPHLGIVKYHGCRVRRGRITAILLERLDQTLAQYARTVAFERLDKTKFWHAVESAVEHLHMLGLAHNDINPNNIMVKEGSPVLVGLGGCRPFGTHLSSGGTPGWFDEMFWTSQKEHDIYAVARLRQWLYDTSTRICESRLTRPSSPIYGSCRIVDKPHMIRILELLPGAGAQPIECRLQSVSLDSSPPPQYTALSYVWGDATFLQPIGVNAHLFGITRNLHAALHHLRDPLSTKTLWVDAICINQSDNQERNHQVALMRRVYQGAQEVVAWLGEAEDDSDLAMDYLSSGAWRSSPLLTASIDLLRVLGRLCSRPYWSRVWVVQELATANPITFRCGYKSLPWEILAEFLRKRLDFKHPVRGSLWKPRRLLRLAKGEEKELLVILREAAEFEASIPLDKVYGLLGLLPRHIQDILKPDYARSFPDLLYELVQAYIRVVKDVEFLCTFPRFAGPSIYGTPRPSWLPDICRRVQGLGEWYNSAGRLWSTPISLRQGVLTVPGVITGRLYSTLGPFKTEKNVLIDNFSRHGRMLQGASFSRLKRTALEYLQHRRPNAKLKDLETAFFNMVSGERVHFQFSNPEFVSCHDLWEAVIGAEIHGSINRFVEVGDYFEGIFRRLDNRLFFVTTDGLVGLGPDHAQVGDIVCVLSGCRLPVVLREQKGDDARLFYAFIGPSYVDGIMSGEYTRDGDETLFPII